MAFPASSIVPAKGYIRAKEIARTVDLKCAERIDLLAADIDADSIWSWYTDLYTVRAALLEIAAIPNIAAYATEQEDDPTLDIVAEFNAMVAAIEAAATWIYQALPRDANGYVLIHKTTTAGELVPRVFAPAATAPLVPLLQAIVDAID